MDRLEAYCIVGMLWGIAFSQQWGLASWGKVIFVGMGTLFFAIAQREL